MSRAACGDQPGRLCRRRGERELAQRTLAPVYEWFTEGSITDDLQEAHTLLDELR